MFQFLIPMLLVTVSSYSQQFSVKSLEKWMTDEMAVPLKKMHENISPPGTAKGVIIASPSRQDPDYYFHWIRDSALVMDALLTTSSDLQPFDDYVRLSHELQKTQTLTGLGEPRFNVDATPFNGPWARPQNDGPALRALTILHASKHFPMSDEKRKILQLDLNYILDHFQDPSFDLWEELKGSHFYTRLVQMAALKSALEHFDSGWNISRQAIEITRTTLEKELNQHWLADKKYFSATLNRIEGAESYKFTDLDSAVVLAALHSKLDSGPFSVLDDRILATASQLEATFQKAYGINAPDYPTPFPVAPAIGRYVDDVYFGGNPWYLTTAAFAELNYRLALSLALHLTQHKTFLITELNLPFLKSALSLRASRNTLGRLKAGVHLNRHPRLLKLVQQNLITKGDLFMARLRLHTPSDGAMAEQFERNDGRPISARDLTWSYASFLTAFEARKALSAQEK